MARKPEELAVEGTCILSIPCNARGRSVDLMLRRIPKEKESM